MIENPCGDVRIRVRAVSRVEIETHRAGRPVSAPEVEVLSRGDHTLVRCTPSEAGPVDLDLVIGYRLLVRVKTVSGAIEYDGFGQASLETVSGDVSLRCPWDATDFAIESRQAPREFVAAPRYRQVSKRKPWVISDHIPESRVSWGAVLLVAERLGRLELQASEGIPRDSPVKMHWQAEEMLPRLFRRFGVGKLEPRDVDPALPTAESQATFSAEVRLVQLTVSARDADGRPVTDLSAADFQIFEQGQGQRLASVAAVETPFNLALLLDCSGSTEGDRQAIEAAARRFVRVAREQDQAAVYALADTAFQVLSRLSNDHDAVAQSVRGLEALGGATPLYDSIILSYAEEFSRLPRERNALVLLTDGVENRFLGKAKPIPSVVGTPNTTAWQGAPSSVSFEHLLKAAAEMDAVVYPIVLDPVAAIAKTFPQMVPRALGWKTEIHNQAEALAAATGGRAFYALSLEDLDGVYEQVADELRSVYTISYYPSNQDFDGQWRSVRAASTRRDVTLRTRPGYYAY